MKILRLLVLFTSVATLSGCGLPIETYPYAPQNTLRANGEVNLGEFLYLPKVNGSVSSGKYIKGFAFGQIMLDIDVDHYMRNAIAFELEKTGIIIKKNANYTMHTEIIELTYDLGHQVSWKCSVRYKFYDKNKNLVYDKVFSIPEKKHLAKGFEHYAFIEFTEIILSLYYLLLNDQDAHQYLQIKSFEDIRLIM